VKNVPAGFTTISLIILTAPTGEIEDLEGLKAKLFERTTPTFRAKKFDNIRSISFPADRKNKGVLALNPDYTMFQAITASEIAP